MIWLQLLTAFWAGAFFVLMVAACFIDLYRYCGHCDRCGDELLQEEVAAGMAICIDCQGGKS